MKHFGISALVLLISAFSLAAHSGDSTRTNKTVKPAHKVSLAWQAGAETYFDNTEYGASDHWQTSETLFGIRATAAVGLKLGTDSTARSSFLAGLSPLYNFGGGWVLQPLLYYKLEAPLKHCTFNILAGAFPRKESKAFYSRAFFSDYNRYIDAVYDGIQFSWDAPKYYVELGVDWMGMIRPAAPATREEFKVYSGGHYDVCKWFRAAYSAYLHHYACSYQVGNVVDDARVNPYLDFEFGSFAHMQSLLLRTGFIAGYHNDRALSDALSIPVNGNVYLCLKNWNVTIDNELYFGQDMLPLYNVISPDGTAYGSALYMADPLLRKRGEGRMTYFDRVGIAYKPRIVKGLDLELRVNFDFNEGYLGTQQIIKVAYNF